MSDESGPTTRAELRSALDRIILRAHTNGVDVDNGGFPLRHDDPTVPDWDVHITRTTKPADYDG